MAQLSLVGAHERCCCPFVASLSMTLSMTLAVEDLFGVLVGLVGSANHLQWAKSSNGA